MSASVAVPVTAQKSRDDVVWFEPVLPFTHISTAQLQFAFDMGLWFEPQGGPHPREWHESMGHLRRELQFRKRCEALGLR